MSIRYKIALLFSSIVTLLFLIISVVVYFYSVEERNELFKTRLKNRAHSAARVYAAISDSNYSILRRIDNTPVASLYDKSVTITGFNNEMVYAYSDKKGDSLLLSKEVIEEAKIHKVHYFKYGDKEAIAIHKQDTLSNFIVAVAANDSDGKEYFRQLKRILFISLLLSVILSFVSGIVFARSLIRPIAQITAEVNLISSRNLSQRIKLQQNGDELSRLASTFNDLLDRLHESFSSQRRFISNASHELSTPLTSVSSQLDVALQKNRSSEEYAAVLQSIQEDIQHLQQLTHSLLDIAKAGSQGGIDLEEIRIDEVLFKVVADIQKHNSTYQIYVNFNEIPDDDKLITTFGNSNLLYMAFKNIIENGCKYATDQSSMIGVSFNKEEIIVSVFNTGEVIAPADISNIFQPFFRSGSALNKPGFGLGLALARQIISLHKGTITVESHESHGTTFAITLPGISSFTRV